MENPNKNFNIAPQEREWEQDPLIDDAQKEITAIVEKNWRDSKYEKSAKSKNTESLLAQSKMEMLKKYPDRQQEIEILYDLWEINRDQDDINELKEALAHDQWRAELRHNKKKWDRVYNGFTSWNYSATDLLIKNKGNEEYFRQFWGVAEKISGISGNEKDFDGLRRGLIGQAGVFHILKEVGVEPDLTTPTQDRFDKIDLEFKSPEFGRGAVQSKHRKKTQDLIFEEIKEVPFPSFKASTGEHYAASDVEDISRVVSPRPKLNTRSFYVVIPEYLHGEKSLNPYTGEPTEKIKVEARKKFSAISAKISQKAV